MSEDIDLDDGRGESGFTTNEAGLSGSPPEPRGGKSARDENVRFWPWVDGPAPGVDVLEALKIREGEADAKKSCAGVEGLEGTVA